MADSKALGAWMFEQYILMQQQILSLPELGELYASGVSQSAILSLYPLDFEDYRPVLNDLLGNRKKMLHLLASAQDAAPDIADLIPTAELREQMNNFHAADGAHGFYGVAVANLESPELTSLHESDPYNRGAETQALDAIEEFLTSMWCMSHFDEYVAEALDRDADSIFNRYAALTRGLPKYLSHLRECFAGLPRTGSKPPIL